MRIPSRFLALVVVIVAVTAGIVTSTTHRTRPARESERGPATPSASPTPPPSTTPSPAPSPSPSPTPRRTTAAPRRRPSPTRPYVPPPPGAEPFVAPAFVRAAVLGCHYDGNETWTIRFTVTVRGGSSWAFADSNAQTMPYQFALTGTTNGADGTVTTAYAQREQWIKNADGSGGAPASFDEHVPYYALRDEHSFRDLGVKLPKPLVAHCST